MTWKKENAHDRKKWVERIRAKIANPASLVNGIKMDVVVVVVVRGKLLWA